MSSSSTIRECGNTRQERIPAALKAVFVQSNGGEEVNAPPPKETAQVVFKQDWVPSSPTFNKKKKMYRPENDKFLRKSKRKEPKKAANSASKVIAAVSKETDAKQTLQEYFDGLLKERGYDVPCYQTLKTGYYTKASQVQIASYGSRMAHIIKSSDADALRETLALGLSANPCNQYGESLLHMVCRRGDMELLQIFVEAGANLQTSDDHGRTPLHDACWTAHPAFDVVETILQRDSFMFFLQDSRGSLPLSYVHKADWPQWTEWLDNNIDTYFPAEGHATFAPSDLSGMEPESIPYTPPKTELSLELIQMVANGSMSPYEARIMADDHGDESTVASTVYSEDDSYFDSEFDSDSDYDELEDDEIVQMFQLASVRGQIGGLRL